MHFEARSVPLPVAFYQAVKGLTGALPIVKQGGTIILAASLSEGVGSPQFCRLFDENATLEGFVERILGKDYFVMDQWQLEEFAKVVAKCKVKVVSVDALPAQLDYLRSGHVQVLLAQQVFEWGYRSVEHLINKLHLKKDPAQERDVSDLVRMGAERGRKTKPDLKLGVCGEHGGDPESIDLFYKAGLNYVSCSPFRVPIARLAAAQAVAEPILFPPARHWT